MMNDYYTLADVSDILQVPAYRITYLLATRQVPEPERIGNRRLFKFSDVHRIAEKLEVEFSLLTGERRNREA